MLVAQLPGHIVSVGSHRRAEDCGSPHVAVESGVDAAVAESAGASQAVAVAESGSSLQAWGYVPGMPVMMAEESVSASGYMPALVGTA